MTDIHSHILPGIDDGSRNAEESVKLLRMLREQGITAVAATPHFNADKTTVESFLARRDEALLRLQAHLSSDMPQIICGAEVAFYPGISRLEGLERLCIGESRLLLLEMPFAAWSEYTVRELTELSCRGSVKTVLAHIERYLKYQKPETLRRIFDSGICIQANAEFFLRFRSRRRALSMIKNREIHFIGSDCHDTDMRPPMIGRAYKTIESSLGKEDFRRFCERQERRLFGQI